MCGYPQMLRTPYRARYWRCDSFVGALWHPSFIRTRRLEAAAADLWLLPRTTAVAPVEAMNFLRFMDSPFRRKHDHRAGPPSRPSGTGMGSLYHDPPRYPNPRSGKMKSTYTRPLVPIPSRTRAPAEFLVRGVRPSER